MRVFSLYEQQILHRLYYKTLCFSTFATVNLLTKATSSSLSLCAVADARFAKEVFTTKAKHYHKTSDRNKTVLRPLLKNGLLLSEDAYWQRHRELVEPCFHFLRLNNMIPQMTRCADDVVAQWNARIDENARVSENNVGTTNVELHAALAGIRCVQSLSFLST
jgi:cytochrome P450